MVTSGGVPAEPSFCLVCFKLTVDQAQEIPVMLRRLLRLKTLEPLDPHKLAFAMGIAVVTPEEISGPRLLAELAQQIFATIGTTYAHSRAYFNLPAQRCRPRQWSPAMWPGESRSRRRHSSTRCVSR